MLDYQQCPNNPVASDLVNPKVHIFIYHMSEWDLINCKEHLKNFTTKVNDHPK